MDSSIVSYPKRGPYGNAKYPGNTTGLIVKDLIDHFKPLSVLDPMEGSGTTGDVCKEYPNIKYFGYDLKDGHDLLNPKHRMKLMGIANLIDGFDLIFLHPPYWKMIDYVDSPQDLAKASYDIYLTRMRNILIFLKEIMHKLGRIAILVGDYRQRGKYYWLASDIAQNIPFLEVESVVIKQQHNVHSRNTNYSGNLIRIEHETMLILKAV